MIDQEEKAAKKAAKKGKSKVMETEFDSPSNTENPLAEDPSPPPPERPPDDGGESLADGALDALEALNQCAAMTPLNR